MGHGASCSFPVSDAIDIKCRESSWRFSQLFQDSHYDPLHIQVSGDNANAVVNAENEHEVTLWFTSAITTYPLRLSLFYP